MIEYSKDGNRPLKIIIVREHIGILTEEKEFWNFHPFVQDLILQMRLLKLEKVGFLNFFVSYLICH
ncbi:hypothetical protein D2V08_15415 [Flagellimonas lutimaris]|uniref:Uncharacterized protein n=1 Tax=Flagellimonas lutimaris TaxID=475082 RepID=A0A3A1N3J3_9FLAO|nr:hypothetical protein D2V08_15415 [Allomuricauda lutimaris]